MNYKTVTLSEDNWERLTILKITNHNRSIDEVISQLLENVD